MAAAVSMRSRGTDIVVSGSLGPWGDRLSPFGPTITEESMKALAEEVKQRGRRRLEAERATSR